MCENNQLSRVNSIPIALCLIIVLVIGCDATSGDLHSVSNVGPGDIPAADSPAHILTHNFGVVLAGAVVYHNFKIDNPTDVDWRLSSAQSTCSCVRPQISTELLKPGESATVRVGLKAGNAQKFLKQSVALTFAPSGTVRILELSADVRHPMSVDKSERRVSLVPDASRIILVAISNYSDSPWKAVRWATNSQPDESAPTIEVVDVRRSGGDESSPQLPRERWIAQVGISASALQERTSTATVEFLADTDSGEVLRDKVTLECDVRPYVQCVPASIYAVCKADTTCVKKSLTFQFANEDVFVPPPMISLSHDLPFPVRAEWERIGNTFIEGTVIVEPHGRTAPVTRGKLVFHFGESTDTMARAITIPIAVSILE